MSDPVLVVCVIDQESGHEAVYVGGELKDQDTTIYGHDIARVASGLTVQLSHVTVDLPEEMQYPQKFEELVRYILVDEVE